MMRDPDPKGGHMQPDRAEHIPPNERTERAPTPVVETKQPSISQMLAMAVGARRAAALPPLRGSARGRARRSLDVRSRRLWQASGDARMCLRAVARSGVARIENRLARLP